MATRSKVGVSSIIFVAQFTSMAFLIICCVTAPVFKQIGLAKSGDIVFGTFGYCDEGHCSSASANYHPDGLATAENWKMGSSAREKLGSILIVMPVAAGLSFLAMMMNFVQHFGRISFSGAAFVINLLLTLAAFASSALMCVVTFLLFYPKVTWCSWLLVPAAALNVICVPLTYVVHSLSPSSEEDDFDSKENSLFGTNVTRLDHDAMDDRYSMDEYNESYKNGNSDKAVYPELYKGPQIATSTTLNSGTTGSRSDRDAFVRENQNVNEEKRALKTTIGRPTNAESPGDFPFENNSKEMRPYSAITDSPLDQRTNREDSVRDAMGAPPLAYRGPSATSSFYSQPGVSRQGTLTTTDLRPTSALEVHEEIQKRPGPDELQNIISGAIREEDDEEFIKQQTIDPSERPTLDEDDGIKDDDSDFTSVSQRGINPNYMHYMPGLRPAYQPSQMGGRPVLRNPAAQPTVSRGDPSEHPHHGVPMQVQKQYGAHPNGIGSHTMYPPYPLQPSGQGINGPQSNRSYRPTQNMRRTSDTILNASPEFMMSSAPPSRAMGARNHQQGALIPPPQTASTPIYRPAYKKRLPKQNIPAASMAKDSPYGGL
ncbi:LADA_0H17106g1_1 [Lachancea dasiensis]|uniref:LADA_0H17106g1_1 n=1 Tax=Lachancea dasiensis TaxID=1072105 RepID=A0A1G4K5F3_9SACH|nr:LADA_0H17106g1_1 [Lachancea dasiensis]